MVDNSNTIIMVARIDPRKVRLFPEILPEAISIVSSTSGTSIASYAAYSPFVMFLQKMYTSQTPGTTLRIDNDSGHAVVESPVVTRPERLPVDLDIINTDSLDLWSAGTAFRTEYAYTLRITKPTVFEKIKYSLPLTEDDVKLAESFDIKRKHIAGVLKMLDVPQFKKVIEVSRQVTVAAAGNTRIGRIVNVKKGEKAVIVGIACDRDFITVPMGGPGANDTFVTLNRDIQDLAYVRLDCHSMPSLDYEIPCYIPAVDRHELIVESVTGVTNFPVRYRYGVADLTTLEKIRWEISLTKDEAAIADQFNLYDSVAAGVL